eukprot:scaffold1124_cov88-Skeletonema_marinoi.AAC.1
MQCLRSENLQRGERMGIVVGLKILDFWCQNNFRRQNLTWREPKKERKKRARHRRPPRRLSSPTSYLATGLATGAEVGAFEDLLFGAFDDLLFGAFEEDFGVFEDLALVAATGP